MEEKALSAKLASSNCWTTNSKTFEQSFAKDKFYSIDINFSRFDKYMFSSTKRVNCGRLWSSNVAADKIPMLDNWRSINKPIGNAKEQESCFQPSFSSQPAWNLKFETGDPFPFRILLSAKNGGEKRQRIGKGPIFGRAFPERPSSALWLDGHLNDAVLSVTDSQRAFCRRLRDYLFIYFAPERRSRVAAPGNESCTERFAPVQTKQAHRSISSLTVDPSACQVDDEIRSLASRLPTFFYVFFSIPGEFCPVQAFRLGSENSGMSLLMM